jgi:hypothetical protein
MTKRVVQINRAPVLTLWGAVVAERLGYDALSALSLGKALSGLNAQAKGRSLGIFHPKKGPGGGPPKKVGLGEEFWIELCGRGIPSKNTVDGVRAVVKDKPVDPAAVQQYLEKKFGEDLDRVKAAMRELAESFEPEELSGRAYSLYEKFRPTVPKGKRGWGAKGDLDLDLIRSLAD